jgi:hypothetical protein
LGNALMVLLPSASQQRLIRGLLDKDVFEDVLCLRKMPSLVEQLCLYQLAKPVPQNRLG